MISINSKEPLNLLGKNLATVDRNADLRTVEESNEIRNEYIKFYNDDRRSHVNAFRQTMIDNGCGNHITHEPNPGYVDYY